MEERPVRPITLTKAEQRVLKAVARGLSNKEIAHEMFISKRTVDFHLAQIFRVLGVKNRILAMNEAKRLKLIKK